MVKMKVFSELNFNIIGFRTELDTIRVFEDRGSLFYVHFFLLLMI